MKTAVVAGVGLALATARADEPRTNVVSRTGPGTLVIRDEDSVAYEPPAGSYMRNCEAPQAEVGPIGATRRVFLEIPGPGTYVFHGKVETKGWCEDGTCLPAPRTTIQLREFTQTRWQGRLPIWEVVPLTGRIALMMRVFSDPRCTVEEPIDIVLEHRPPDGDFTERDELTAIAGRAGLDGAAVLARWPDDQVGHIVLLAGTRAGAPEVDLVATPTGLPLMTVAHGDGKDLKLTGFAGARDLVDVQLPEARGDAREITHHVIRVSGNPVEICHFHQYAMTPGGRGAVYQDLAFEAAPDATFDVISTEWESGQLDQTKRRERWRLTDHGCARVE
jgi:hypothetical protein